MSENGEIYSAGKNFTLPSALTSARYCMVLHGIALYCIALHCNAPKYAKYAKYAYLDAYWGAHFGARKMVKWDIPEKILQNAVQTRWS